MNMEPELLPCPWCGKQPEIDDDLECGAIIRCVEQQCPVGPEVYRDNEVGRPGYTLVTQAWNTRTPKAAP